MKLHGHLTHHNFDGAEVDQLPEQASQGVAVGILQPLPGNSHVLPRTVVMGMTILHTMHVDGDWPDEEQCESPQGGRTTRKKRRTGRIVRLGKFAGWIMPGRGQQFYELAYADLIDEYVEAGRRARTPGQRKWRQFAFSCRVIVLWLECIPRAILHSPLTRFALFMEAIRRFLP